MITVLTSDENMLEVRTTVNLNVSVSYSPNIGIFQSFSGKS